MSIWISEEGIKELRGLLDSFEPNECEPLCEYDSVEELYIDRGTGNIEGMVNCGDHIGIAIDIKFKDWFPEFIRLDSFKDLEKFLVKYYAKELEALESVKRINSLSETKIDGDDE